MNANITDNKRRRRCRCHKMMINTERDQDGIVVKRICMKTMREIDKINTYLSTKDSTDDVEAEPKAESEVQKGVKLFE
jgi:hypothetical protein